MKRDTLKSLGLDNSVINIIMAENGNDIEKYKSELATTKDTVKQLQLHLAEANKALNNFNKSDVDRIRKSADEWKAKAIKADTHRIIEIESLKFDRAIESAIISAKAKNVLAVKALLDIGSLNYKNSKIIGLKEQLKKIKEENDYLFYDEIPKSSFCICKISIPHKNNKLLRFFIINSKLGRTRLYGTKHILA